MRTRTASRAAAIALLLTTTALTAPGYAQTATTPAAPAQSSGTFGSTQPTDIGTVRAGTTTTPSGVTRVDIGGGYIIQEDQPKQRSTVTRDAIAKLSPTANPYQMIAALPGTNVQSADAFGLNGGNITIRGFNSDQLGLTIDGAPVNDSGNYALYPQEYLDSENIGQISVAQGYSDLDSPHIGATGGVINIYSIDPSKKAGGYVDFSYGSSHTTREYVRLETGQIGRVRGYASYSHYENDHWRGPGGDYRDHFDAKVVADIGDASKITVSAIYNKAINNFYRNPTMASYNQYGYSAPQNNYDTVYNPGGTTTLQNKGVNGYYKTAINPFENLILSAPSTFAVTSNLTVDVTPYFWYGYGNGGGYTTLNEAALSYGSYSFKQDLNGNGTLTDKLNYYYPSITQTYRPGIIAKATYQLDNQKFVLGTMYEAADHHQYGSLTPLNADGSVANAYGEGNNVVIGSGPFAGRTMQKREQHTNTRTNIIFGGDTISLLDDRLTVDLGVKQAFVSRHGQNDLPSTGATYVAPLRAFNDTETLPTAAATYKLDDKNSVFIGFSTSFRTPQNYTLYDPVSTGTQKPETAMHLEIGHRFQGEQVTSAVSVFGYKLQNREFNTTILDPTGGTALISTDINAGSTTSYGIEAEIGTRPINNFRPYASFEFIHDTLDSNLPVTSTLGGKSINDFAPTRGKFVPNSPQVLAFVGVDYDDDHWFGNFSVKYTGRQFSTFTNDEVVPGFATANAAIGYRFDDISYAKRPELSLKLFNIADQTMLTGATGPTTTSNTAIGKRGGTISGSKPSYYVGQGFAALVTLSAGF